ncbi:hypothetical protein HK104_000449 [Borealophlyctis nickersoniae]|nr:hypothetical protein HK104_000449 [Borealophlyctis nickersoniae]
MPAAGSFTSWGKALAAAFGYGDSGSLSEARPLLSRDEVRTGLNHFLGRGLLKVEAPPECGHTPFSSHQYLNVSILALSQLLPSRAPQRKITSEGTTIVIWPSTPTTFSQPCTFSIDLPSSLDDALPAPLYRSHVAELNALLRSAHLRRKSLHVWLTLTLLILLGSLAGVGIWLAAGKKMFGLAAALGVVFMAVVGAQPFLAGMWFADLLATVESEIDHMVTEWNARAPAHIRFHIAGAGNLAVHPSYGLDDEEGPSEPELHVIVLDLPLRRQQQELAAPGAEEVLITPEGDGMMMAVKVIRTPSNFGSY